MATDHIVTIALGTSIAAIVFSSAQSAYGHYCKGSASIDCIRRAAPWVIAGVLIGGAIAARTPAHPLLIFVGGFQLFAAFLMMTDVSYFKASGIEPKLAIGTSAAIGLALSLAGVLAYGWEGWGISGDQWAPGYIDLPAALALVLGTLLTVRVGVATAHWLPIPCAGRFVRSIPHL